MRGFLTVLTTAFAVGAVAPAVAAGAGSPLEALTANDRILIVAPHPDDETLCCAGLIARARAAGARVSIVWLTMGDAFSLDADVVSHTLRPKHGALRKLGERREKEAHAAAELLGVPLSQQYFLGYPDRGLLSMLHSRDGAPITSAYTHAASVWYDGSLSPGAAYTSRNLLKDFESVIAAERPTLVLAPSVLDRHPDHSAGGELASRLAREKGDSLRVYYWIVHSGTRWPVPRGLHPDRDLDPPHGVRGMKWIRVPLDDGAQRTKLAALAAHATQMKISRSFLQSFVRRNELFTPESGNAAETASR